MCDRIAHLCARGVGFTVAHKYYEQMLSHFQEQLNQSGTFRKSQHASNYFVDEVIYSIMLNACVKHGRLDVAMEVYSR